ncbi:MAG: DUF86 domain-containing protein [Thiobacillaceae bacterium]|jgi:uncharacterized protein with HEPN domain|nr:DUF86 domain-containing protein [Thiobacillaceae bacterium]
MSRDPRLYLDELIEAAENAMRFAAGEERQAFQPGQLVFEAIVRQIEIIGEAAAHLPDDFQARSPAVPWANLISMRNRLIHGYFAIDPDIVWSVVHDKLPALISELKKLSESLP